MKISEFLINLISVIALISPIILIIVSLRNIATLRYARKNRLTVDDDFIGPKETKEIFISISISEKLVRESLRIALDRYKQKTALLMNLPIEAEKIYQIMAIALHRLHSKNSEKVILGLQTFSALGTNNLYIVLREDFVEIRNNWGHDSRLINTLDSTEKTMSVRLIESNSISVDPSAQMRKLMEIIQERGTIRLNEIPGIEAGEIEAVQVNY